MHFRIASPARPLARFALGFGLALVSSACRKATPQPSSAPSASAQAALPAPGTSTSAPTPGAAASPCLSEFDTLVPFQKYGEADLIRAISVDGEQVYFRNMKDVFRVPLAGGPPSVVSRGPGLDLSGRTVLWVSGDRLLTQSAHEPIFMASPKAGGAWTTLLDLSRDKLGGGRSAATRILQGLGRRTSAIAEQAVFDGKAFYWVEQLRGTGKKASTSSSIHSVELSGQNARTLYDASGELRQLGLAGDRLVFIQEEPSAPEPKPAKATKPTKGSPLNWLSSKEKHFLRSIPVSGGTAQTLARIGNLLGGELLLTDGPTVYVSGYEDEDLTKPGVYRIAASAPAHLERIDPRVLRGQGFVYGDRLAFVGDGLLEPARAGVVPTSAKVLLTGTRTGSTLERSACILGHYTAHAFARAGQTLLVSLFRSDDNTAAIIKLPLP